MPDPVNIDVLVTEFESLTERQATCQQDVLRFQAQQAEVDRQMVRLSDEIRQAGVDPSNFAAEVERLAVQARDDLTKFSGALTKAEADLSAIDTHLKQLEGESV